MKIIFTTFQGDKVYIGPNLFKQILNSKLSFVWHYTLRSDAYDKAFKSCNNIKIEGGKVIYIHK